MSPFFSIIIPVFNKERHVLQTLESVQNQSFQNFEIIIVNDGSTDNSEKEILKFQHQKLKYFKNENKGASHSRNFAASKAKAPYIAFLDADDIWLPHHLEDLKNLIDDFPNCGMYCKAYTAFQKDVEIKSRYHNISNKPWRGILKDYFESSMQNSIATTPAVAMPRQIFESKGGFNEVYQSGQDIDLWIRVAIKHLVAFDNNVSVCINLNADNKLSEIKLSHKTFPTFEEFEKEEKTNQSLKMYLDLNRFVLAIKYKIEENSEKYSFFKNRLNQNNLSFGKRLALKFPSWFLKLVLNFKSLMIGVGLPFKLFK